LELTCLHIPMVIAYRASFGTWLQYRWARRQGKLQVIGLPNIIAQRQVVPELLQAEATPQRIAEEATRLLTDHSYHQTVVAGLAQVATELGEPGATRRTAEMVLALAAERFPARGNS